MHPRSILAAAFAEEDILEKETGEHDKSAPLFQMNEWFTGLPTYLYWRLAQRFLSCEEEHTEQQHKPDQRAFAQYR